MNNLGQAGLAYWAPNINIFRDPRLAFLLSVIFLFVVRLFIQVFSGGDAVKRHPAKIHISPACLLSTLLKVYS